MSRRLLVPDCQPGDLTFIHLYYDTRISKGSSHDWSSISFAPDTIGADMRDAYEDSPPMGSQNACWTERELERELETGTGLNWCLGATHRNHCLVQKREFLPSPGTGTALCLSDKAISCMWCEVLPPTLWGKSSRSSTTSIPSGVPGGKADVLAHKEPASTVVSLIVTRV